MILYLKQYALGSRGESLIEMRCSMSKYETLNPRQQEAVFHTEGPLLVLAGAGSGKTRVLTHRIAYLIEEKGVNPWNILAITFTNKAAGEMRERVDDIVGFGSESIWVSTFHSTCVRILRRHIENLGYTTSFTIYDGDDQRTLMKQVMKTLDLDPKQYRDRSLLSAISAAKDQLITPEEFLLNAGGDFRQKKVGEVYKEYQRQLKKNNALDFDDLILKTVELFNTCPDVLEYYQERFKYIMVDEYQDTNFAQFKLVYLMASKYKNLCVVGDDDQSIYKFRGADIENILSFEKSFPGARVIKLEQNYRSTKSILDAANEVIRHNRGRKDKTLWTDNEQGETVRFCRFNTAYDEADAIVREIAESGRPYSDFAVLYRTNAQSRLLEEKCIARSVPYRLVGGVNFYQRKEIKDILCYLKTVANGQDDLAVARVINVPKRGIGATTMGRVTVFASEQSMSLFDALLRVRAIPGVGKAADKIERFTEQIMDFRDRSESCSIKELIEAILNETGYRAELEAEGEVEAETRMENIEELINKAVSYSEAEEFPTLDGFLEEVALVADVDSMDDSENRVVLMTLHGAKGLEFPVVYLSGMEDGLFPSTMAILSDDKDAVEEERRLCYVGITRAREKLTLTMANQRMVNGETRYSRPSRFLEEIPPLLLDMEEGSGGVKRARMDDGDFDDGDMPWGKSFGGGFGEGAEESGPGNGKGKAAGGFSGSGSFGAAHGFGRNYSAAGGFGSRTNAYAAGQPMGTPAFGKSFTVKKPEALDYVVGDRVRHIKFGSGTVAAIEDGGKDFEVTVDFDRAGRKKMFASFAKLVKEIL